LSRRKDPAKRIARLERALERFYAERDATRQTYYAAKRELQERRRNGELTPAQYSDALRVLQFPYYEKIDAIFDKIRQCKKDIEECKRSLSTSSPP